MYTWDLQLYLQLSLGDCKACLWLILVVKCPNLLHSLAMLSYKQQSYFISMVLLTFISQSICWSLFSAYHASELKGAALPFCTNVFLESFWWQKVCTIFWVYPKANSRQGRAVFQTERASLWLMLLNRLCRKAWRGSAHPGCCWGGSKAGQKKINQEMEERTFNISWLSHYTSLF